ncbi:hypothetical protein BGX26_007334 [Mortierella sp. AD094]|nr:hypothetical protein BGX26_007334 [Mortierella sp. AD094]
MDDGFECVARLSKPYFSRYKSESEVATMQFVSEKTSIRVPKVYAWDANPRNSVGAEYILMEKIPGVPLITVWKTMSLEKKKEIVSQVVEILLLLFNIKNFNFERIGSLYKGEVAGVYRIGPAISDALIQGKRASVSLDRGPWVDTKEYFTALIRNEIDYSKDYGPSVFSKLEEIIPSFCPGLELKDLERLCLQHPDLHLGNIMVYKTDLSCWKISGIIDWETSGVYPSWSFASYPIFLESDRIDVKLGDAEEGFDPEHFNQLLEETELRKYFKTEVGRRCPEFCLAMERGLKSRMFESQVVFARDHPGHVYCWIEEVLRNRNDGLKY